MDGSYDVIGQSETLESGVLFKFQNTVGLWGEWTNICGRKIISQSENRKDFEIKS